jgi:hypothetical protein
MAVHTGDMHRTQQETQMTTRKRITRVLTVALVAMGIVGLTVGSASAATSITIVNGGFEAALFDEDGAGGLAAWHWIPNWDEGGGSYYGSGAGGYLYLGSGGWVDQDLSYNWSTNETFTLSIDGQELSWSGSGEAFSVQLRQANEVVLWDSGPQVVDGITTWSNFSWTIAASNFTTGTEGSELNIQIQGEAASSFVDDITLSTDLEDTDPPTLAGSDFVDDKSGGPVNPGELVTYTVTFSEAMDDGTVSLSDFDNAGTATMVFVTLTSIGSGVYSIPVVAATTGTLQLRVPTNAVLADLAANPLDASSAILDDNTINVVAKSIEVTGGDFEGANSGQDIPEWFDSDGSYADWHQTDTADTSHGSKCALLNNGVGYMYQSLGQLGGGAASLDWSFDQVRLVVKQSQCIGTADLRFFYGVSPDAAQGTDIDTLGLTQIGSTTNFLSVTDSDVFHSGSLNVSSVPAGSTIWMDFTHTLAVNDRFFLLDNISVTEIVPSVGVVLIIE